MTGRRAAAIRFLTVACLAIACQKGGASDSLIVVAVEVDPIVTNVVQVRAMFSNDGATEVEHFPAAAAPAPLAFPTAFSVTLPAARSGPLEIALEGLSAAGAVVASGRESITIESGRRADVGITLVPGGLPPPPDGAADGPRDAGADTGEGGSDASGDAGADAGGADPCREELLVNGGFEDGVTGWTAVASSGRALVYPRNDPGLLPTGVAPRSGDMLAWLGDPAFEVDTLGQQVRIPALATSLRVTGFVVIDTEEGDDTAYDFGYVEILRGGSTLPVAEWSNQQHGIPWLPIDVEMDATALRDATVTFQLRAVIDTDVFTSFFFDDLSLTATICP